MLFVCVHNAGRSQMAAGLVKLRSGGRISVRSAGSAPVDEINPAAIEAMAELGVDLAEEHPKPLTDEFVKAADVVITMGCGDACPIFPGKRYEDWVLDDPAGQGLEAVRVIRDEIDARVKALVAELLAGRGRDRGRARAPSAVGRESGRPRDDASEHLDRVGVRLNVNARSWGDGDRCLVLYAARCCHTQRR